VNWLGQHSQISIPPYEITTLKNKEPWDLVEQLYESDGSTTTGMTTTPDDPRILPALLLRGYKNPSDICDPRPIRLLKEFFPKTKLIIGIRHPIRMMESFYNHRVQNGFKIKPFDSLGYGNLVGSFGVHFSRAEYHVYLANLGLTDLVHNTSEQALFPSKRIEAWNKSNSFPAQAAPNPVFLYDTAQLSDSNATRLDGFLQDLQNFLGLTQPLPPPLHEIPGMKPKTTLAQQELNAQKVDVCNVRYKKQRRQIKLAGAQAQSWILDYFLSSPTVYVSNEDHFREIVQGYGENPCAAAGGVVVNSSEQANSTTTESHPTSNDETPVTTF
jgi:hypothetical protein